MCYIWGNMSRNTKTPTKWHVRPAKPQISLGIHPVWSVSLLSIWRKLGSLATHWVHSEESDQTGRMPRLIWVFAGRTVILLVLSCCGSYAVSEVYEVCFSLIIHGGRNQRAQHKLLTLGRVTTVLSHADTGNWNLSIGKQGFYPCTMDVM